MQGLFIDGRRPKSKKEIRETLALGNKGEGRITVEAASFFGNEYDGPLVEADLGTKIEFVGPNPLSDRRFYGRLVVTDKGVKLA